MKDPARAVIFELVVRIDAAAGDEMEFSAALAGHLDADVLPRLERREKAIDAEPFEGVRERFEAHLAEAVAAMGGADFRAVPAEHCFERFAHGQCAIHVLPEVTE